MALPPPQTREFLNRLAAVADECRADLEEASQSIKEIAMLISQSNSEVERLTQRERQLSNRVREIEANLEVYPRADIREAYHAAHENELRLMMMRSQVEQLQERERSIQAYQEKLRLLIELADSQVKAAEERRRNAPGRTRGLTDELPAVTLDEIIQAQEDERLRVSQRIMDGPAQVLANVILEAEICERVLDRDPTKAASELEELRLTAMKALADTRRMLYELRPVFLTEMGVVPTLRRYLAEITRSRELTGNIVGPEHDDKLTEVLRIGFYRLLQEMIAAVISEEDVNQIDVDVRYEDAQAVGRVEAAGGALSRSQSFDRFLNDEVIQRRVEHLGGDLQFESLGQDSVRLTIVIPLA